MLLYPLVHLFATQNSMKLLKCLYETFDSNLDILLGTKTSCRSNVVISILVFFYLGLFVELLLFCFKYLLSRTRKLKEVIQRQ